MKIETFTLRSNDTGGIATLRQAHPDCGGSNISPQLSWINIPEDTHSFALTMFDKDAPVDGGFWHWLMFDIPANVNELPADAGNTFAQLAPGGSVQSINDYGLNGYGGPNPPHGHGWHNYMITLYALDIETLELPKNTPPALVGVHLWRHTLAKASIVFYYRN
ncbi:MAG: YbhB/YbcL family Raf kinase inhibitor-like protein [Odoribacter sp.]